MYWATGFARRDARVEGRRCGRRVEHLVADQRAVRHRLAATGDDARLHAQASDGHAELRRRQRQQHLPGGRGAGAKRWPGLGDRRAADGVAGVGCDVRVRLDPLELAHVHVELFAGDHQQAVGRALPEVHATRVHGGRVVAVDRDPRVDLSRVRWTRDCPGVRRRGCLGIVVGLRRAGQRETDDQRAAALDERLARELLLEHFGHGYFPPFAITAAAFWIAVRILRIGPATAEMAVHRGPDLRLGRTLRGRQQIGGLDHHPVLAVTAVRHLHIDPRLLQRMQSSRSRSSRATRRRPHRRHTLERRDRLPAHSGNRRHTRTDLLAVQQHRAGAALRETAAEARAVQMQLVVQDVQAVVCRGWRSRCARDRSP